MIVVEIRTISVKEINDKILVSKGQLVQKIDHADIKISTSNSGMRVKKYQITNYYWMRK